MGQPRPLIVYFQSFQTHIFRNNCRLQRYSNSDFWVEGEHTDHLTTTTAQWIYLFVTTHVTKMLICYLLTTRARLSQKPSKTFLRKWLHGSSQLRSETLKYFYLKGWFTLCSKFAAVCNSQLHFYREIRNFLVLHCCSLLRFCRNVSEQASMSVFPKSSFLLIQFIVR